MIRLLKYASVRKVAEALKVKRQSVHAWSQGHNVSPARLVEVRALLRDSLGRKRNPPQSFDWDGLMDTMSSIAKAVGAETPEERLIRLGDERKRKPRGQASDDGSNGQGGPAAAPSESSPQPDQ